MMQPRHDITDFQKECTHKVRSLIQEVLGRKIEFKEVIGRKETFYQSQFNNIDIYVYSDEAGFMLNNKDWVICEKPDYDSQEELMEDFLLRLRNQIARLK